MLKYSIHVTQFAGCFAHRWGNIKLCSHSVWGRGGERSILNGFSVLLFLKHRLLFQRFFRRPEQQLGAQFCSWLWVGASQRTGAWAAHRTRNKRSAISFVWVVGNFEEGLSVPFPFRFISAGSRGSAKKRYAWAYLSNVSSSDKFYLPLLFTLLALR